MNGNKVPINVKLIGHWVTCSPGGLQRHAVEGAGLQHPTGGSNWTFLWRSRSSRHGLRLHDDTSRRPIAFILRCWFHSAVLWHLSNRESRAVARRGVGSRIDRISPLVSLRTSERAS